MSRRTLATLLDDLEPPPITEEQAALCLLLRPRLEQLSADVWALAQKSPALAADPALVGLCAAQLADLRRLLRGEPGLHLLPQGFAPGIGLSALALGLRAGERALALFLARRQPEPDEASSDFETLSAILIELTRDTLERIAANRDVTLPPQLRRSRPEDDTEAEPAPEPAAPRPPFRRNAARRHARLA